MSAQCPECHTKVAYKQEKCHLCETVLLVKKDERKPRKIIEPPLSKNRLDLINKHQKRIDQLKKERPDDWQDHIFLSVNKKLSECVMDNDKEMKARWAKTKEFTDRVNSERIERGGHDARITEVMPPPWDKYGLKRFYEEIKKSR